MGPPEKAGGQINFNASAGSSATPRLISFIAIFFLQSGLPG
jgi:hypothetical protein